MTQEEIRGLCLAKPGAYEDYPFGDTPVCCKVRGKIFAQIYADKVTLKCTAFSGQMLRQAYPDIVVRGYHCPPVQQPYWNTIYLDRFPQEQLSSLIDHAYETVVFSLPKKLQREIHLQSAGK